MSQKSTQRRLAAVLVADVVGYSRLMEADEVGTLAALQQRRKNVLEPVIKAHGGRIVKVMGDGVLTEFVSAVNAVIAAIELQRTMAAANDSLPYERHIVLRVGINLSDVIGEGSDIYGEGVNIAARLEALAAPGGICVSAKVHDEAKGKVDTDFEDLGEQHLKNIARPVRAYSIGSRLGQGPLPTGAMDAKTSVAVLPFTNMSGEPEQEYFSDGMTEDIITELSRFRSLLVIARNSCFIYKGKAVKIEVVGRELGVDFVVEGSVRRAGDRLRITAQLINVVTGSHVWAERYDRKIDDLFAVQDEVVRSIVGTIEGRLASAVAERIRAKPKAVMAAYEQILQARQHLGSYDAVSAEPLLRKALAIDPAYAQAYAWLAMVMSVRFFDDHDPRTIEQAVALGRKAVELDDSDSLCHMQLAVAYLHQRQFEMADIHSQRALSINPSDMLALSIRADWLNRMGRGEEALRTLDDVLRHDPYPPDWYWENRSIALLTMGQFDQAIAAIKRKIRMFWWNHCYLGVCFAQLGQMEQARCETAEAVRLMPVASISKLMKGEPYHRSQDAQLLIDGLRKAGLPE